MTQEFKYYTVGGFYANGRPIDGGEYLLLRDARDECNYLALPGFGGAKAYPRVYGWVNEDAADAVEIG